MTAGFELMMGCVPARSTPGGVGGLRVSFKHNVLYIYVSLNFQFEAFKGQIGSPPSLWRFLTMFGYFCISRRIGQF